MNIIIDFLNNFLDLTNAMSIYILVGLLIAGVLKQLIPNDFISSHLGNNSVMSVIKSTILGIPLPVCSCSVIPLAKSLEKEGASKGAVQSFLISSPITGVDSILATYSFFGIFFTLYRVITSMIMAIIAGILQNIFAGRENNNTKISENTSEESSCCSSENISEESSCCSSKNIGEESSCCSSENISEESSCCSSKNISEESCCSSENINEESSCCSSENIGEVACSCSCNDEKVKEKFSVKKVFSYAYMTLFGDIAKALFIGLIIGAIFTTFLPKELLNQIFEYKILTYFLILVISLPMYICATSSLPIVASLMMAGMSGGAGFIFLSAGPATNSVTMGVITQMFGKKSLFIYLGVISISSIIFGIILDLFPPQMDINLIMSHAEHTGILNMISSILMLGLIAYSLIKPLLKKEGESCSCHNN